MASNNNSSSEAASSPDQSPPSPPQSPPEGSSSSPSPKSSPPSPPPSSPPPSSPPPSSPPPTSPPPPSSSGTSSSPPSPPSPISSGNSTSSGSSPSPPTAAEGSSDESPPPPSDTTSSPSPPTKGESQVLTPPQAVDQVPQQVPKSSNPAAGALSPPRSTTSGSEGPGTGNNSNNSSSSDSSSQRTSLAIGVTAASAILIVMLLVCVICSRRKKRKQANIPYSWQNGNKGNPPYRSNPPHGVKIPPPGGDAGWPGQQGPPHMMTGGSSGEYSGPQGSSMMGPPSPGLQLGFSKSMFTYEELAAATNGFNVSNVLGQGGFGVVHKGILPNGKEVAVKSLKAGSGQGEREFQSEVEIISRVHHRHLVSLVGYCIAGAQRVLVYEFVPNNTLEYHLHKRGDPPLDFSTRLRIALGSAKGLAYLHEDCHPRIIHRDIKASNILLDYSFEAQVADFGLAKLTTDTNTHVSTRVMGTFGYLAPEYAASGKLTEKSDVFSFGVMLLELVTGRPPVDPNMQYMEDSLVDWARPLLTKALEDGNYNDIADPWLERNYNPHEMKRMVACAAACIRHSARKRPKMSQIVRALEGDVSLDDLNEGVKPGHSTVYNGSSDYDHNQYSADLKKFRQVAFSSVELESGGGTTSEYGLNPSSSSDSSRESSRKF